MSAESKNGFKKFSHVRFFAYTEFGSRRVNKLINIRDISNDFEGCE